MSIEADAARESPQRGLSLRGIGKSFGPNEVLRGIDLDIRPGEVLALIGENGAGKSTLSAIISGALAPSAGEMAWNGRPYAPASPRAALDAGIGMIHQEMRLLPELTIAENVFVGRLPRKRGIIDRARMNQLAAEQLARLGLDLPPTRLVATLKVAAQQQVEIAKALALDARLLILDEPTSALGGQETDLLFRQIEALRRQGYSFLYISHRLEELARLADRIAVLRDGELVAVHGQGKVATRLLVEQMVGRSVERMFPELSQPGDDVVLEVKGLSSPQGGFGDVSFTLRKGEILGIAGLVGAGRTEVVRALTGADPAAGEIRIDGRAARIGGPADAIRAGMALVPEDRKLLGAILEHSVAENIAVSNLGRIAKNGWLGPSAILRFARRQIGQMGVRGRPEQRMGSLSGGNQQKAIIAKWLPHHPKIFVLDEPTRGIDVGARAAIYKLIADLARAGMAIIVVSSDLDEVLGLAHRVAVMRRGRLRGILARGEATRISVMELAA
ncbi:MAG: sugar ABC transporter ATP-binding protein [Parvibaculaceae bacterium]